VTVVTGGAGAVVGVPAVAAGVGVTENGLLSVAMAGNVLASVEPGSGVSTSVGEAAKAGPTIHAGQQGKHIPGDNNFMPGKSELTHPDPQALLDKGTGTGVRHGTKEVVDFGEENGTHVAKDGTRTRTTRGTIHYNSKNEDHIVPALPEPPK
jgi:hypothetical protein